MTTDTILEDDRWDEAGLSALAERAVAATMAHLGLAPGDWEVAVLGCNDARITELNGEFREKAGPTNVLSWPSEERAADAPGTAPDLPESGGDPELGDIAIAYETCVAEADEAGRPFAHHVTHLIVHGTLHLLGYDHIDDRDAALMERIEVEILATLGIPDPY